MTATHVPEKNVVTFYSNITSNDWIRLAHLITTPFKSSYIGIHTVEEFEYLVEL
jgi:hypothetical protein